MTASHNAISWTNRSMPTLNTMSSRLQKTALVHNKNIVLSLTLNDKTANLPLALHQAGANVSVLDMNAQDPIQHSLQSRGIHIYNTPQQALDSEPNIIIDSDGNLAPKAQNMLSIMGGIVQSTSQITNPSFPILSLEKSPLATLFTTLYGVGQTCVMGLLDVTNLQLAGRSVLVVGYDAIGQGIARHATAMGAKVTVAEKNPIKGLQAFHDGHAVNTITKATSTASVVFVCATGVLTHHHLESMQDGVIICTAGHDNSALPMDYLNTLNPPTQVRQDVDCYALSNGKSILLIGQGHALNDATGKGVPIENIDLCLSLYLGALDCLITEKPKAGIHTIPEHIEHTIAIDYLHNKGHSLDS